MNDFVKWEIELNPNSTRTEDGTERDDPYADPEDLDDLEDYHLVYPDALDDLDDNEGYYWDNDPADPYLEWLEEGE